LGEALGHSSSRLDDDDDDDEKPEFTLAAFPLMHDR
jgi:hypothetical protein